MIWFHTSKECWCLTEDLLSRLRSFHHRCIRAMCGVTRWYTWRHRTRTAELRKRLRVENIDFYVNLRMLCWAGHVARMGHERLPRRFLTSWVRHPRPHGRPQFTFGHTLNKTLARAGLPTDFEVLSAMAQDRTAWRAHIYSLAEYPTPPSCARRCIMTSYSQTKTVCLLHVVVLLGGHAHPQILGAPIG